MKKKYILPLVLLFVGLALFAYVKNKEKTNPEEFKNKIYPISGTIGGFLMIAGTALGLYRIG